MATEPGELLRVRAERDDPVPDEVRRRLEAGGEHQDHVGDQFVAPERVAEIIRLTQEPPPHEATHWTLRAMAKVAGIAASTVQAIWKAHGLSPHRWRQFKLSNDP